MTRQHNVLCQILKLQHVKEYSDADVDSQLKVCEFIECCLHISVPISIGECLKCNKVHILNISYL